MAVREHLWRPVLPDQEELDTRYPTHEEYVDRVTRAADRLLAEGYIVELDRDVYVQEAIESGIGR